MYRIGLEKILPELGSMRQRNSISEENILFLEMKDSDVGNFLQTIVRTLLTLELHLTKLDQIFPKMTDFTTRKRL